MHVDDDDGARAREARGGRDAPRVLGRAKLVHGSDAEEAHDARRALERTEHERDAAVLAHVGDRFDTWIREGRGV